MHGLCRKLRDLDVASLGHAEDAIPDVMLDQADLLSDQINQLTHQMQLVDGGVTFAMVDPDDCPANCNIGPKGWLRGLDEALAAQKAETAFWMRNAQRFGLWGQHYGYGGNLRAELRHPGVQGRWHKRTLAAVERDLFFRKLGHRMATGGLLNYTNF